MTQGTTPPGWYDDGTGGLRWWDGTRWTDHVQLAGPPSGQQPRGRKPLLLALLGVVAALVVAGVIIAVVVLGGDDDSTDEASGATTSEPTSEAASELTSEAASPSPSETPAPSPSTATPPPAPEPSEPGDVGQTTCGEVRAMSTDELVDLLDRAARQEVARGGDEDAQTYLDLPRAQRRAFAEFLPTTCEGEPDGTALDDIDDF